MRRHDKEITGRARIDWIIRQGLVCRVGLTDGRRAYIVPLSYGYDGHALFFHTAREGRKLDMLAANPDVCFEIEHDVRVIPDESRACAWGMSFYSVIGTGVMREVVEPEDKLAALNQIMAQYSGQEWPMSEADARTVRVWRLEIEEVTGKKSKDKAEMLAALSSE